MRLYRALCAFLDTLAGRGEVVDVPPVRDQDAGRRTPRVVPLDELLDPVTADVDDDTYRRWAEADDFDLWEIEMPAKLHRLAADLPERAQ